jgi:hypothetical protein
VAAGELELAAVLLALLAAVLGLAVPAAAALIAVELGAGGAVGAGMT